ncbi:MAG TPA: cyclase family protein [Vicinamibacterales bacterium]|nr:cyclase family protein [Vicinamibacterales bacterium]
MRTLSMFVVFALGAGCSAPPVAVAPPAAFPAGALVDLSHDYGADTIFWPTADPFRLDVVADGMTPAGFYYAANTFATSEHGGTHLDAPVHFAEGRQAVDQIPLERLIGPAVVIDVNPAAEQDPDYQVTVADFEAFEAVHGRLPDGVIVLVRTGYSSRWPDAARYLGTAARGPEAIAHLHFPGIDPAAARWLVAERSIDAVGIDTASIDYGQSTLFESHRILYEANIPGLENLTALDRLPPTGALVIALPMKIRGGSGAPLRAVAIVPERR